MTHYDPNVYDPSKLTGDDALVMKGFELCRDAVLRLFSDIAECGSPVECCVALLTSCIVRWEQTSGYL